MAKRKALTDEELRQLALDIYRHLVFTDRHVPPSQQNLLPSIFLPLGLAQHKDLAKTSGMLYEYYSAQSAGGHGIRGLSVRSFGFPIFFSVRSLSRTNAKVVWQYYAQIEQATAAYQERDHDRAREGRESGASGGAGAGEPAGGTSSRKGARTVHRSGTEDGADRRHGRSRAGPTRR